MVATDRLDLARITCDEVQKFAGNTIGGRIFPLLDDHNQRYGLVYVPDNLDQRPAWVMLLARVVDDSIVIEEDTAVDKTLLEALMVNGGVPREQIILAYKGEKLPQPTP